MKKFLKSTFFVLLIGCVVAPRAANAFMILDTVLGGSGVRDMRQDTGDEFLCAVLFPFCILKDNADVKVLNVKDLIDNGFTSAKITNIEFGQTQVLNYMKTHHLNTTSQMASAVRLLWNHLNPDYQNYVLQTN